MEKTGYFLIGTFWQNRRKAFPVLPRFLNLHPEPLMANLRFFYFVIGLPGMNGKGVVMSQNPGWVWLPGS